MRLPCGIHSLELAETGRSRWASRCWISDIDVAQSGAASFGPFQKSAASSPLKDAPVEGLFAPSGGGMLFAPIVH